MANILDYVDWRGDLSFEQDDINVLDLICFSQLSMLNFSTLMADKNNSFASVSEKYKDSGRAEKSLGVIVPFDINMLFCNMAECNRFLSMDICDYVYQTEVNRTIQFSAISFVYGNTKIVSFSGTDDTIVGWEENFSMMHQKSTLGQAKALDYLDNAAKNFDGRIFVTGHSKGGNLALYAFLHCKKSTAKKIVKCVCFDGPGVKTTDFEESDNFEEYGDKLLSILPEESIIGRIFVHKENCRVVKSTQKGLYQHDCFSWEVLAKDIVEEEEGFSPESEKIKQLVAKILDDMEEKEKISFAKSIFKMMYATESFTLTDLSKKRAALLMEYVKLDKEDKKVLHSVIAELIKSHSVRKVFLENFSAMRSAKIATKEKLTAFSEELKQEEEDSAETKPQPKA